MNDNNDYPFTSTYPDTASAPEQSDGDVPTNIVPPLNGQPKYEMEGESTTPYVAVSDTATNPATSTATTTPPHTFEAYDDGINNMPSSCSDRCQPLLFMEMEASVASSSGESRSIASSISSRVSSSLSAIANEAKKLRKKAKKKRKKDADPNATSSSADSKRRVLSKSAKLFALCAALNSCNLGYDIGVSTEAGRLIQDDWGLTTMERELFTGSLNFWAMFGAFYTYKISDKHGRRMTFLIASGSFLFGSIIQAVSTTFPILLFGRIFIGLGVGVGLAVNPLYIAEVTPAAHRGEMVTWSEIGMNVGLVLGFATGIVFANLTDDGEWRTMFALGSILPVVMILLIACNVMPESPRWLLLHYRTQDARMVLQQIYYDGDGGETTTTIGPPVAEPTTESGRNVQEVRQQKRKSTKLDAIMKEIQVSLDREREARRHYVGSWGGLLFRPSPAVQHMLFVGLGVSVGQQLVGMEAIQYYFVDVIINLGIKKETTESVILVGLGLLKLAFVFLSGKLVDKNGRRPLLLLSLVGMSVSLLFVSASFLVSSKPIGAVLFGLALYLIFYSVGMGPVGWLIPSEVFSTCIRARAMSLAMFSNRLAATIMSSTMLSLSSLLGLSGFFFLLAVLCLIMCGLTHQYLPETKDRSLEEMSRYFAQITNDVSVIEVEERMQHRLEDQQRALSPGAGRKAMFV